MSHEIVNPHARRLRDLSQKDSSRYRVLRLTVSRVPGSTTGVVSVMLTDAGGHRLRDTRLAAGRVPVLGPGGDPLPWEQVLEAALTVVLSPASRAK